MSRTWTRTDWVYCAALTYHLMVAAASGAGLVYLWTR